MTLETDFGYTKVSLREKTARVRQVFSSVASKYDLMNDLMSLGLHRYWKQQALRHCRLQADSILLDLATGSGDLALAASKQIGSQGAVCLVDMNAEMLRMGKIKLINAGQLHRVTYVQSSAEQLALAANTFDCVTLAFGLRNFTDKLQALRQIYRVLKPGGRLVILEFSHVTVPWLAAWYEKYSFSVLPWLGACLVRDEASYRYLAESIRRHPNQQALLTLLAEAGFEENYYRDLTYGIVAIHVGFKL
jgi:demethylmenaquinone methyltransferase/2-methoxy-6-polyprenyl-1,4-benzoquinol methylase